MISCKLSSDSNSHSRCAAEKQANISDGLSYGIALAELVGFIEETRKSNKDVIPEFRLADLVRLYSNRLAKAAQIVRRDMQLKSSTFSGTFESSCQEEVVPKSLLTLVDIIMGGGQI